MLTDIHNFLNQVFDGFIFALFARQSLTQRSDDRLGDGFAGSLRKVPSQLVGFRALMLRGILCHLDRRSLKGPYDASAGTRHVIVLSSTAKGSLASGALHDKRAKFA